MDEDRGGPEEEPVAALVVGRVELEALKNEDPRHLLDARVDVRASHSGGREARWQPTPEGWIAWAGVAPRCYTESMPTTRPRVTITETPDVARRLELAAARFPDRSRSRSDLLLALTEVAEDALRRTAAGDDAREAAKQRLLERTRAIASADAEAMLEARERDWKPPPAR